MKFIIFILIFFNILYAKTEITWNVIDFAPFMLINSSKSDGLCVKALDTTINNLPEYKHKIEISSLNKTLESMEKKKLVCSPCLLKTEKREKNINFSKPYNASLGIGLLVKKRSLYKLYNYFDEKKEINIDGLLSSYDFKIGIASIRSYGSRIDKILKKYENESSIVYQRQGNDFYEGLFKMLIANRDIDGTLIYYSELDKMLKKYNMNLGEKVLFYEIQGTQATTFSRIACTSTLEGKKFISIVNTKILKLREESINYQKSLQKTSYIKKMTPIWNRLLNDEIK